MTSRRISATWTGRVKRGSPTRKLARHRTARRLTGLPPLAGRKMTADEAMQFALDKYESALRRLAQIP